MINSIITRVISALGIIAIMWAHFISLAQHKEFFVICAVSYFIRAIYVVSFGGAYFLELLGLLLIVICWLCIGAMGLCLFLNLILNGMILIVGESHRILLRVACVVNYMIGIMIFIGLYLVIANQSLPNFGGVDKIEVDSDYFLVPAVLIACGGYFNARWSIKYTQPPK